MIPLSRLSNRGHKEVNFHIVKMAHSIHFCAVMLLLVRLWFILKDSTHQVLLYEGFRLFIQVAAESFLDTILMIFNAGDSVEMSKPSQSTLDSTDCRRNVHITDVADNPTDNKVIYYIIKLSYVLVLDGTLSSQARVSSKPFAY